MECVKQLQNSGRMAELYYFRDSNRNEVDLLIPDGPRLVALEIKSATTFKGDHLKGLRRFKKLSPDVAHSYLVYNAGKKELSDATTALNFRETHEILPG